MTKAIDLAAAMPQSKPSDMFDDVFEQPIPLLEEQRAQLIDDLGDG
jgi:hypothetical protein